MTDFVKERNKAMDSLQDMAKPVEDYQRVVEIAAEISSLRTKIDELETKIKYPEYSRGVLRSNGDVTNKNYSGQQRVDRLSSPRKTSFVSMDVKIAF